MSSTYASMNTLETAQAKRRDTELLPITIKVIDEYFQDGSWNDGIKAYALHIAETCHIKTVHLYVINIIKCIKAIKELLSDLGERSAVLPRTDLIGKLSQETNGKYAILIIKNYEDACQFISADGDDRESLGGSSNHHTLRFKILSFADELITTLPESILKIQDTWINSNSPEKSPREDTIKKILYQDPDLRNFLTVYTLFAIQSNKSIELIDMYVRHFINGFSVTKEISRLKAISKDAPLPLLRRHDMEVLNLLPRETMQWIIRRQIKDIEFSSLKFTNTDHIYIPEFYWQNFRGKIPEEIVSLAEEIRLSCQHHSDAVFRRFINLIYKSALDKPYLPALVLAGAILLGAKKADNEPLSPLSIKQYISVLLPSLRKIFEYYELKEFSEFDPNKHLKEYLTSHHNIGEMSDGSRYNMRIVYSAIVSYQKLLISSKPQLSALITSHLFPVFTYTGRELVSFGPIGKKQRHKRKKEAAAFGRNDLEIYQIFMARQIMLDRLQDAYTARLNSALKNKEVFPVEFSLKISGLTWNFAITNRELVLKRLKKLKPSCHPRILDTNPVYLEYINSIADGGERGAPPFFINYIKCLHDKITRDQFEKEWGYDFTNLQHWDSNLLKGPRESIAVLRTLAATERKLSLEPSVIFDFDALYTGTLIGSTALLIGYHLGLRMHEYQQIRLDAPYTDKFFVNGKKRPVVRIRLKGLKGSADELSVRLVPQVVWDSMMKLARRVQGHHQGKIPRVKMSDGDLYRVGEAPYLFQNKAKGLTSDSITAGMRFMFNDVIIKDDEGKIVTAASHLLRHNFTRRSLNSVGDPRKVGKMLGHSSEEVTNYYGQSIIEDQAVLLDLLEQKMPVIDVDRLIHDPSISEPTRIRLQRARDTYGALGNVPGGECTALYSCPNTYTCVGCGHKVINPQQRHEVEHELAKAEIDLRDAHEMNSIEVHRHKLRIVVAHQELEVMDALEVLESFRKGVDASKDLITSIIQKEDGS
ncbi:tyrosine-type recombinase/integrase [Deinococcus alpinitundrae]|uniref:tyrosine-type recombinase/integrase n=1 Tax=Deinococcus alpinitundrae TaxID=468913 RepID=UPI001379EEAD|nr:tyrosine-type recombinase/integrase [Deinococcus alpinitundrae]